MIKNTAYMKRRGARPYAGAAAERCILREEKRRAAIHGLLGSGGLCAPELRLSASGGDCLCAVKEAVLEKMRRRSCAFPCALKKRGIRRRRRLGRRKRCGCAGRSWEHMLLLRREYGLAPE